MTTQRDAATRLNLNIINLESLTADPTELKDGDVWFIGGVTPSLRIRANGATYQVDCTIVP